MQYPFSLWRLERWISRQQRSILEVNDPVRQQKEAENLIPEITANIRRMQEQEEDKKPGQEVGRTHEWASVMVLAISADLLDIYACFQLTWASVHEKSRAAVLALCVLWTTVLSLAAHVASVQYLRDLLREKRTVRNHFVGAGIAGAFVAVGLVWFAAFRGLTAQAAGWLANLSWVPFVSINIGAPIACGILSSLALHKRGSGETKTGRLHRKRALAELRAFKAWLEGIAKPSGVRPPTTGTAIKAFKNILNMGLIGLVLAGAATPSTWGSSSVPISRPSQVAQRPQSRDPVPSACAIFADWSASVDPAARRQAIGIIEDSLDALVNNLGCGELVLSCFTDAGRFSPREYLTVPWLPQPTDCSRAKPEPLSGPRAVFEPFENIREYRQAQATASCERSQAALRQDYDRDWVVLRARVHAALNVSTGASDRGTAISPLLASVLNPDFRAVIVLTDGLENPRASIPTMTVPSGMLALMVIVPPRPPYGTAEQSIAAAAVWQRKVQGLHVIFSTELQPKVWKQIASTLDNP